MQTLASYNPKMALSQGAAPSTAIVSAEEEVGIDLPRFARVRGRRYHNSRLTVLHLEVGVAVPRTDPHGDFEGMGGTNGSDR